ncbi:YihY/virulence factor BrkB family protein [Phenylobacterium sp. LjRoot164]|uniref:YihY/virulence factor BrkB family protein n=1 Tax=unclassified Phenylobacterium TaxID=2640670 RepID=UPI003ECCF4EB
MRGSLKVLLGVVAGVAAAETVRGFRERERGAGRHVPTEKLQADAEPANLEQAAQTHRGRHASEPTQIPARGWKDILLRTYREFGEDQIPLVSAGVTFYSLLALFPAIAAFVALYGLFADPADVRDHLDSLSAVLPAGAISLIGDQLARATAARAEGLSLAFVIGLAVALWSANGAMKAMITGVNIAYEERERRGLVGKILIPLAFTVGGLLLAIIAIALAAFGGVVDDWLGPQAAVAFRIVLAICLFAALASAIGLLYRFGPSRRQARWRWITWGSGIAALAWLAMSAAFTFYVARFGNFDRSYGPLGAAIGFMTWTWLSAQVILLGAELNSEIEHQTAEDTTVGLPKPLGARGAVMADTVGAAQ